ncbi:DUF6453 family protein [Rosenbergiella australiborealis]|uniref:DUF6453 family protein n=1 Tax=Rosenbergiella australiborealis TaxID=1544696 RepID=UPI001F4E789A|nr:DUF6453 family protein [Rosenbergiella australiborealis]
MTYGIRYTPDGFSRSIELSNARVISYLGSVTINTLGDGKTSGNNSASTKQMQNGATPLIIPRNLVYIHGFIGDGTSAHSSANSVSFSGNTLTAGYDTNNPYSNKMIAAVVDVFSVGGAQSASGYGIRLTNSTNFLEISDTSYLGFVTWVGTIDINGTWDIPSDIVSLGNYVVFANWNNTTTPIYLNRNSNRIECYTSFDSASGSAIGGSVLGVKIIIVSCGFSPQKPSSGYGILIRNSSGQITFSSKYAPAKWNGASFNMNGFKSYDTNNGEILSWSGVSGGVIYGSPMVPLCSIGMQTGNFNRASKFRPVMYSGMKMNGSQVTSSRGAGGVGDILIGDIKAVQISCSLPALDTADYF